MKRELIYSLLAFFVGFSTIIIAPTLSHPPELSLAQEGLPQPSPPKAVGGEVYVPVNLTSTLPTILSIILVSVIIAGSCAFIVKKQSR